MATLQGHSQRATPAYVRRREPRTARNVPATAPPRNSAPPAVPGIVKQGFVNLDQYLFAIGLAAKTGLSLRVIIAWIHAEEPASADPAERGHNWLNVGVGSAGGPKGAGYGWSGIRLAGTGNPGYRFHSTADAVTETAWWINNMGNFSSIRAAKGESDGSQLAAISASPWDASHYGNGANLTASYRGEPGGGGSSVFGNVGGWLQSLGSGLGSAVIGTDLGGGFGLGGAVGAATGAGSSVLSVGDFLSAISSKTFWIRVAFVIVGLGFGLAGLFFLFTGTKTGQTIIATAGTAAAA